QLGAWLLPRTPIPRLQLWFGLLSLATALRLVMDEGGHPAGGGDGSWAAAALLVGVGAAAGVLAGLLGVGGGIIMVPALVILAGADADVARGTSLLAVIGTALTASVANARHGLVASRTAAVAGLAGVPAGIVGAAVGQWIPGQFALALFAGLLVWSGVRMIVRSWGSRSLMRACRAVGRDTGIHERELGDAPRTTTRSGPAPGDAPDPAEASDPSSGRGRGCPGERAVDGHDADR
ncbi:MAG: sulfite exporter TauE/SafE family protein, partial [Candidatus Nanopelagicales bacterium]